MRYDNLSTVMLADNSVLHSRTKHIELSHFFVREQVMQNKSLITHMPSADLPIQVLLASETS